MPPSDDRLRHAAQQQHAAERDDERLELQARDQQALDQPDQQRDGQRRRDADPERVARAAGCVGERDLGDEHAGQADDRADRQVDAAGDDDEADADREDAEHRDLPRSC